MNYNNYEIICVTPSTKGYYWVFLTDRVTIFRKKFKEICKGDLIYFESDGYILPLTMKGSLISNEFYTKRALNEYVNQYYIDLGIDEHFIRFELIERLKHKPNISYNNFIINLKYGYIEGHILDIYWDIIYDKYMTFIIHPNMSNKSEVIEFVRRNKKRVNKFVAACAKIILSEVNLTLNYYQLTNITVTNDCRILYQFSFKLNMED